MKTAVWAAAVLAWAGVLSAAAAAAPPLKLTAYVNVSSGCQKPTEDLLRELAAKYPGRLSVEVVDFGQPEGRQRWQADGMHCMAIVLDGSPRARVVFRGAELEVSFLMPPGYNWLLQELAAAVRQRLDGVTDEDRKGPPLSVRALTGGESAVLAGETTILDGLSGPEAERVCSALQAAARTRPLLQDDFALDIVDGMARVTLRGEPLLDLGLVGVPAPADAEPKAAARFLRLIEPFPRVARPFPAASLPAGKDRPSPQPR